MSRKQKPGWERGYNGHVYWFGKKKLGKVTVHADKDAKHKYTWEAAGRAGATDDLGKAKKSVEAAVAMADKQLDLFG
ncbi:MAG TPA: hypothetical protein VKS43_03330 [Burkholderiales bacterium]|nr:hypothetical protein [Burkholderiales bacterium]